MNPTPVELNSLSAACNKLWELDDNRLRPEIDYRLNMQSVIGTAANAPMQLLSDVNEEVFKKKTFGAFAALLDNYTFKRGKTDHPYEPKEQAEITAFLTNCMATRVMQYVHAYLLTARKTTAIDPVDFIAELDDMWFSLYSRETSFDTCGFEHVFVGEIKYNKKKQRHEVTGFHNWIQLYLEERRSKGNPPEPFDYLGFLEPREPAPNSNLPDPMRQLLTIRFKWHRFLKSECSILVGTSPEFELALYTLCFYCGGTNNRVRLDPYGAEVVVHREPTKKREGELQRIATSYPMEIPPK